MIEGKGLTMRFGNNTALDGVDVCFGDNKIYGLLGRNGAGKSTLLSVVTNRLLPTAGEVFIDGEPARENDRVLGRVYYMGEKTLLPDTATVAQLFRWTGDFYPGFDGEYAGQLADTFGLPEKKKLKNLSTGYLTIAKLIAALASNAPYTLFDEPVLGLDANHREVFYRQLIESYSRQPRTILISTHLIEEVADIIEQVVIIKAGKILLDRPAEEVKRMGYTVSGRAEAVDAYCTGRDVLSVDTLGGLKTACILGKAEEAPGLDVSGLDMQKLFIRLTNV
ncbi:ATP-binding cassette domain-containing protein [Clostridia bacterium]|jgi:ABC-2 type transport system ATP-binding protein